MDNPYITSPDEALARLEARGEYFNGEEWASREEHQGRDIPLLIAALRHWRDEAEERKRNLREAEEAMEAVVPEGEWDFDDDLPGAIRTLASKRDAARDEAERLRTALAQAEAHMTSPKSGRGCVCRCSVIDGHTADCVVVAALAPQDAGKEPPPITDTCGDCPPVGYPTDKTRCDECPRLARVVITEKEANHA